MFYQHHTIIIIIIIITVVVQGVPCPRPEIRPGLAPAATPRDPLERDKGVWTMMMMMIIIIIIIIIIPQHHHGPQHVGSVLVTAWHHTHVELASAAASLFLGSTGLIHLFCNETVPSMEIRTVFWCRPTCGSPPQYIYSTVDILKQDVNCAAVSIYKCFKKRQSSCCFLSGLIQISSQKAFKRYEYGREIAPKFSHG